jgi:hypothetical protein
MPANRDPSGVASGDKPSDKLSQTLDSVLTRTIDWVKYAEAKNGILLTVDAAATATTVGWLITGAGPPVWLRHEIWIALALLTGSILAALTSFLPVLDVDFLRLKRKHGKVDSLLYFGAIAGCSGDSYLESLRSALDVPSQWVGRMERDYAMQIVINAQIATAKFRMFRYAAWMTLISILIPSLRVVYQFAF